MLIASHKALRSAGNLDIPTMVAKLSSLLGGREEGVVGSGEGGKCGEREDCVVSFA